MIRNGVGYDVVLIAHVVAGLVGFGAISITAVFARNARDNPDSVQAARYFRRGTNWASRIIFAVPVLGLALAGMGEPGEMSKAWVLIPIILWLVAAAVASAVHWPAERAIQEMLNPDPEDPASQVLADLCSRATWSAAVVDIAFLASFVIMIAKPGG